MTDEQMIPVSPTISGEQRAREVLRARARALARPPGREQFASEALGIVEFRLAQEYYAIEQTYVREVHRLKDLTPLPGTPTFLPGVINMRGQILPVIDIRQFFDLPDAGITDTHMVILVYAGDVELGILADAIIGVRSIPLDTLQPPLPTLTGIRAKYLKGVTDEHLAILDARNILADAEIILQEDLEA